jgi:hypothetical protein
MRKILIVGSSMGMNGCQLIRLQDASIILNVAALDLLHAVEKVKSDVEVSAFKEMTNLISVAGYAESDLKLPIKEKKPKYIRQQHKLAQRHYRRK